MPSGHLVKGTKVTVANTPPRIYYQKTVDVEPKSKERYWKRRSSLPMRYENSGYHAITAFGILMEREMETPQPQLLSCSVFIT